jgi:hypothetical protein
MVTSMMRTDPLNYVFHYRESSDDLYTLKTLFLNFFKKLTFFNSRATIPLHDHVNGEYPFSINDIHEYSGPVRSGLVRTHIGQDRFENFFHPLPQKIFHFWLRDVS